MYYKFNTNRKMLLCHINALIRDQESFPVSDSELEDFKTLIRMIRVMYDL